MEARGQAAGLLDAVDRLADALAGRTPGWFAGRPAGTRTRAEVLRHLVATLALLGVDAGTGQPPETTPPVLGDHALADQLRLLTWELASGASAHAVLGPATDAVALVRRSL